VDETWDYEFSVWPASGKAPAVYELFRSLVNRVCVENWTTARFGIYRDQLAQEGLTLREITRVPHHKPQVVL
jgi:hypothetical protein